MSKIDSPLSVTFVPRVGVKLFELKWRAREGLRGYLHNH